MMKLRSLALAGVLAVAAFGVAHADALGDRQTIFKNWGDLTRPVGGALQGKEAFDLAKVKAALAAYVADADRLPSLFPDNSMTGKTEASPKIWAEKAKFEAGFAKLKADAQAADTAIVDAASFKANIGKVLGNCKACHDDYRIKK